MFFDIEHSLCEMFVGLNPLALLEYPAEDVFTLINNVIDYQNRNKKDAPGINSKIRRPAKDNWF